MAPVMVFKNNAIDLFLDAKVSENRENVNVNQPLDHLFL